jgi:apolipoprotein N-acyltransferase
LIAPDGTTIKRLPQYQHAGLYAEVPLMNEITFYSSYGDWFAYLVAIVSALLIIISYLPKKSK